MTVKERWADSGFKRTEMTPERDVSLGGEREGFALEALRWVAQKMRIMRSKEW